MGKLFTKCLCSSERVSENNNSEKSTPHDAKE